MKIQNFTVKAKFYAKKPNSFTMEDKDGVKTTYDGNDYQFVVENEEMRKSEIVTKFVTDNDKNQELLKLCDGLKPLQEVELAVSHKPVFENGRRYTKETIEDISIQQF